MLFTPQIHEQKRKKKKKYRKEASMKIADVRENVIRESSLSFYMHKRLERRE